MVGTSPKYIDNRISSTALRILYALLWPCCLLTYKNNNMIKTKTTTYSELAKQVRDMILFNQLTSADDNWMHGFIVSPLLEQKLESDWEEQKAEDPTVEVDEDYRPSVYDYAESIYQTFIIDDQSALWLYNNTSEIISYSEKLDAFFWHVCHYGTSWSGVHTEVRADDESTDDDVWDVTKLANLTIE